MNENEDDDQLHCSFNNSNIRDQTFNGDVMGKRRSNVVKAEGDNSGCGELLFDVEL